MMMNLDFLNIQPPKQSDTIDLSKKTKPTKEVIGSSDKQSVFETKKTKPERVEKNNKTNNDAKSKENDDKSFSDVLKSMRTKDSAKDNGQENNSTAKLDYSLITETQKETIDINLIPQGDKSFIYTQITSTPSALLQEKEAVILLAEIEDIDILVPSVDRQEDDEMPIFYDLQLNFADQTSEEKLSDIQIALNKLASINEDIESLLKSLKGSAPKIGLLETLTTTATSINDIETEKASSDDIMSFYALLLNSIEPQTDQNTNIKITDTVVFPENILQKIAVFLSNDDNKSALLSNKTPEDLTQLQTLISQVIDKKPVDKADMPKLEELVTQVLTLQPLTQISDKKLQVKIDDTTVKSKLVSTKDSAEMSGSEVIATDVDIDIANSENKLVPQKHFSQSRYDDRYDIKNRSHSDISAEHSKADNKAVVKDADNKMTQLKSVNDNVQGNPSNIQRAAQFLGLVSSKSLILGENSSSLITSSALGNQASTSSLQSSLTNPITQSGSSAAQPHPATQAVVATIQKAAKTGEDTNIKLQLDPPELGRVEVKMSISKDAKTKVVLTVEKSETLLLLQKDVHTLDKALQNAGLETNLDDLSFELASDNQNFNNNNKNNSDNNKHSSSNNGKYMSSGYEDDVIETVMNWHVDPLTGAMRYNALV